LGFPLSHPRAARGAATRGAVRSACRGHQ
jgi:hypothetical protein